MEQIFLRVLNMSITAGYCILVVLALRRLFKKFPKRYAYLLWSVVYFRLACPVSVGSVLSLIRVNVPAATRGIAIQPAPEPVGNAAGMGTVMNYSFSRAALLPQAYQTSLMQTVLAVVSVIWAAVAVLLFLYNIRSALCIRRRLKGARHMYENVYEEEGIPTAFVYGLITPRIYLPKGLGEVERDVVLAHERTHIRRGDHLMKPAAFLLTCVHWFNPLAWISFGMLCKDMEMSCDERVIRQMGKDRKKEYSTVLLALASDGRFVPGTPLAFGEGAVKSRIKNILAYRRTVFWEDLILAFVIAAALIGLALNPRVQELQGKGGREVSVPLKGTFISDLGEILREGTQTTQTGAVEHLADYRETALQLYFPAYALESDYVDPGWLTEAESEAFAQQALHELYDLTGTSVEECFYCFDLWGTFSFGLTQDDMEHQRYFLIRTFGANEDSKMQAIATMYVSSARRVWFSPVYQYELPENYEDMTDVERAVWFVKHSGQYNGQEVSECFRPYDGMPEVWRIVMKDDTAYEISLDNEIDSFYDIAGPYPDSNIRH